MCQDICGALAPFHHPLKLNHQPCGLPRYVLQSLKDGKRYIGFTSNLERRLVEHHSGNVSSTKNRRPLELIYSEDFSNKQEAEAREKFFKSGQGRAQLKQMGL